MKKIVNVCSELRALDEELNIAIVIGPEGGIASNEIEQLEACNKNAHTVSIGNSILRTETAGVVASAIIKFNLSC